MSRPVATLQIVRVGPSGRAAVSDRVVVEEPLEIRWAGDPLSVTMRTPGHDRQLALGFLLSEGYIQAADDLGALLPCGRPGTDGWGNVVDAVPGPGYVLDVERHQARRRGTLTSAACGVCGRQTIDDLLAMCRPVPPSPPLSAARIVDGVAALRGVQALFDQTGGTHAAAAFDGAGARLAAHEDIGRHNAVDKVVGELLLLGRAGPRAAAPAALLVVSGRCSFEMVQKAAVAGVGVVASVSAPSSLAIALADRLGMALAGFVRGPGFNLYCHPERVSD